MNARVSSHGQVDTVIARLQAAAAGLGDLQDQVSSGIKLSRPSQGPADYVELRLNQEQDARMGAYQAGITDVTASLNQGVSTLQDINQIVTRANAIAIEGADSSTDANGQAALATEVDGLIGRLMTAANGKTGDRYLFGGTATNSPPFTVTARDSVGNPTAVAYSGSEERGRGLIGPGQTVDAFYAGDQVFQRPGADVFQALIGLRDELRDPSLSSAARAQALTQRIGTIQTAQDAVLSSVGEQSAGLDTLQAVSGRLDALRLTLQQRSSDLQGTDIASAVVRMREMDNLYQATLGITSRMFQSNFTEFIR